MHESLRDKCNDLGCSINDYLVGCIELVLDGSTNFDFGDEEEQKQNDTTLNQKPQQKHDGKIPTIHLHWEDRPQTDENKVSELRNVRIIG